MADTRKDPHLPAITSAEEQAAADGARYADLDEMQQRWIDAMLETGGKSQKDAARIAGYANGASGKGWAVAGHRNAHNPKVLAVLRAEADIRLRSGAVLGASALIEMVQDQMHKDRFKAAVELLNRAGLLVTKEVKINVEHKTTDDEKIAKIIAMSKKLGLDPAALLGQAGVQYVDAEFSEVPDGKVLQLADQSDDDRTAEADDDTWTINPGDD
jgi:hypothetical protein